MGGSLKVALGVVEVYLYLKDIWNVPMIIGILELLQGFILKLRYNFIIIIRCISYSYCCFVHRYKLHVQVRHNQDRTTFVISDPACANFFGISALELKRSLSVVCRSHLRYGIILTFITCALLNHLKYIMHLILGWSSWCKVLPFVAR
jgi:hypothetical protein